MINEPDRWPRWPLLPLKRRRGARPGTRLDEQFLGFLVDVESPPYVVYVGTMFLARPGQPSERYNTLDALLQEWKVD